MQTVLQEQDHPDEWYAVPPIKTAPLQLPDALPLELGASRLRIRADVSALAFVLFNLIFKLLV